MKKISWKKALPHLIVLVSFLLVTLAYFSPIIEGKQIKQQDVLNYKGMAKEIMDHREKAGEEPLWTNSMFSGMPAYQISVLYPSNLIQKVNIAIKTWILPHPVSIIFMCFAGFYLLLILLGLEPLLAALGAFAFGLSSYLLIIIEAGHNPKGYAIAYMAPVIGGILLTYRGKYLFGAAITAFFLSLHIDSNHLQITYYLLLMVIFLGVYLFVTAYKEKTLPNFFKASAILVGAALLAVAPNLTNLVLTSEYGKYSTRGRSDLSIDASNQTSGLDKDYATQWSYGVGETFTLMIPNFHGGASGAIGDNKSALKNVDPQFRQYIANVDSYWGNQPFTSGPVYVGAIICFLFVLGLLIVKDKIKWWVLAITILSITLSWGRNFMPLTSFFMDYVPGYNKFRAVSMTLVIAEFAIPFLAVLALKEILLNPSLIKIERKKFAIALGSTAGLCLLFLIMPGAFMDFFKDGEYQDMLGQLKQANFPDDQASVFLSGMEEARKSIFTADASRSLIFILIGATLIWLYSLAKISKSAFLVVLGIFILFDLWTVDKRYLNSEDFVAKGRMEKAFEPTQANLAILEDKDPNFRVMNFTVSPFQDASTSYFHKSIGGYHGAKLKRYQELFDFHLSKQNMKVYNMLNTKYFIVPGQDKQPTPQQNREALGNAWFVSDFKIVANADSEIAALNNFDPASTVIIDKKFAAHINGLKGGADSASSIKLLSYEPNHLVYESNSAAEGLAVFSEIYYDKGWNAYVDGAKKDYIRVNYVLRGMRIPAGKHKVEFKFEPQFYYTGEKISLASSILLIISLAVAFFWHFKKQQEQI